MRTLLGLVLVGIALAGCNGGTAGPGERFADAVESGAPCAELFAIRNELDPKSPLVVEMNDTLRGIGGYSSSAERAG